MKMQAIVLLMFITLFFPVQVLATGKNQALLPKNPVFQPVAPSSLDHYDRAYTKNRSVKFDGGGRIDRIDRDEIVISDRLFYLASKVRHHSETGRRISAASFKEGKIIRFKLNKKREIVSLWLDLPQNAKPCE
jgi:hypothetical protein